MNDVIRTFIAIKTELQPELVKIITLFQKELKNEAIRWVDPQNMHITVKFIGDTSREQVSQVTDILKIVAGRFPVFSFNLNGVGFFRKDGQPNVLFVKAGSYDILNELAEEIENRLQPIGFPGELRPFHPHLTMGRIRYLNDKAAFKSLIDKYRQISALNETCRQLIFYQSILNSRGSVYKPLAEFQFGEEYN